MVATLEADMAAVAIVQEVGIMVEEEVMVGEVDALEEVVKVQEVMVAVYMEAVLVILGHQADPEARGMQEGGQVPPEILLDRDAQIILPSK